jgi:hypothetical protein
MTIDDEQGDEQNETLVNSLLAKISLSRRSDNRHFANRYIMRLMSIYESCDTVLDRCDAFPMRDEIGNI